MGPGGPQPEEHQHNDRAGGLMGQIGGLRVFVRAQALGAGDAEGLEDPFLHLGEHIEEPDAERDLEIDQVEEADPSQVERDRQVQGLIEKGKTASGVVFGYEWEVVVEGVETEQDEGHGKPQPHPLILKKRSQADMGVLLNHVLRQLDHGVRQPLVRRPLAVEDGAQADQHEAHGHDQGQPIGHRLHPDAPRDGRTLRQALVVILDGLEILRRDPRGDKIVEQLGVVVFWGRVVEGIDDGANEEEHQAPSRHRDRHDQHAVNQDEIGFGQGKMAVDQGHEPIDGKGQKKKEKQGTRRRGVKADPVVIEHDPIRGEQTNR